MTNDVRIQLAELPTTIGAYVICDQNGFYTIVLNSRLSHEQNMKSYVHEMKHINNGDYEKSINADLIELFAHYTEKE